MPIEKWSDSILVVCLADDPQLADDLEALDVKSAQTSSAVLDFASVHFVNSSNIAKLLKLRRAMVANDRQLVLCAVNNEVWSTFLTTGLDKIFQFSENVPTALATVQMHVPRPDTNPA